MVLISLQVQIDLLEPEKSHYVRLITLLRFVKGFSLWTLDCLWMQPIWPLHRAATTRKLKAKVKVKHRIYRKLFSLSFVLESCCERSSVSSLISPVVVEESMRPVPWWTWVIELVMFSSDSPLGEHSFEQNRVTREKKTWPIKQQWQYSDGDRWNKTEWDLMGWC